MTNWNQRTGTASTDWEDRRAVEEYNNSAVSYDEITIPYDGTGVIITDWTQRPAI